MVTLNQSETRDEEIFSNSCASIPSEVLIFNKKATPSATSSFVSDDSSNIARGCDDNTLELYGYILIGYPYYVEVRIALTGRVCWSVF